MSANLYNPCPDGLPAKLWECLRRNEEFKARVEAELAIKDRVLGAADPNPFADVALRHLLPMEAIGRPAKGSFTIKTSWPDTTEAFRLEMKWMMARHSPRPEKIQRPPLDLIGKVKPTNDERVRVALWRNAAKNYWENYDVVVIPKFIRDSNHRKEVIREVTAFVRSTTRRGLHMKSTGRTLGAPKQWAAYLLIEGKRDREKAFTETALAMLGGTKYRKADNMTKEQARQAASNKQRGHIVNRYDAIKDAIALVYPGLRVFE